MNLEKVDILAFAAHPDDIELSASGTIMKHIADGKTVAIVDLTQGELGSRGTIETRFEEAKAASKIMGISFRTNLKMPDGFFDLSESNKRLIIEQIRRFQPTIVLANAYEDRHPDHGRASKLVSEACFLAGLIKIETTWEGLSQKPFRPAAVYHYIQDLYVKHSFVIDISNFIDKKFEAIFAYNTQFYYPEMQGPQTPISSENFIEFLKGRMATMGRDIDVPFAEGFTVERTIGVQDIFDLI